VSDFHSDFGLPPPHLNIIHNGPDPGNLASQGDELESDLDVEWASAVAKGATIDFVVSASTNASAGVDLSAEYIIDNDLAPIMSESYGACELDLGTGGNQFFKQLWQQAAAEGITVFISTGDSGSSVCDRGGLPAIHGLSVNGLSSTPYNVAVGGTDFDDLQNQATFWNSTNNPVTQASAKGYIPESTWNDSCTNSEFFQFTGSTDAENDCNNRSSNFWPYFLAPIGASGGASNCTTSTNQSVSSCAGGYAKPLWQTGPGVPNDGKRDVPDVSLFAADGLNSSFYVVCESDIYGGCAGDPHNVVAVGGTSASTPVLAGIMAMVNQKTQSRQGNANYVFYPLAAQPGASCNSSGSIGSSCIFYDVTKGTIAMPCQAGTPNCVTNIGGDQFGVLSGYDTTAGYDLSTGLGSVNAANLVNNWNTITFHPTVSTLSLQPTTQITHGSPVSVNITVAPKTGTGTPAGEISLLTSAGPQAGIFTLANGSVTGTTELLPGGSYNVTAHYAGDGTYAASDSSPDTPVVVTPEASTTALQAFTFDQNGNASPYSGGPYGASVVHLRADVTGQSGQGVPSGTVNLTETQNGTATNFAGNPYPLNSEGYTMAPLPGGYYQAFTPGTYSFTGSYSGDVSFNPSTSPPITFTVTRSPTTTTTNITPCSLQTGQCSLPSGTQVIIFANVLFTGSANTIFPTGTMTFLSNGTPLGPPVPVDSAIAPPLASFYTNQLPSGLDSITAQYSGDTNYSASTSTATVINIGAAPPTFSISANPTAITVASHGQSGSTILMFTAQNGFTGSAALSSSLCSNLPPKSTCTFSTSTVTLSSSTINVPVTLTISTTAPSSGAASTQVLPPAFRLLSREIAFTMTLGVCFVLPGPRRRWKWRAIVSLLVVAMIASSLSCGGGTGGSSANGGGTGGAASNSGTPIGSYTGVTVTVTISGVTQSVNNLSVQVQ
jgi:hypothetical protein